MENLLHRFINYVKIDTQSDENSQNTPSTEKQWTLARMLVDELQSLGLTDAYVDEYCYVYATLPSNITDGRKVPTIGFIAHMDTSPDFTAEKVNPQIVENYDGGDIVLNKEQNIVLSPKDFPELKNYIGQTLITTDGTTLLGADDKAGIAEIMTALEYLTHHPEIKHGTIKVAFTPDEEIGRGTKYFDVKGFGADFAYTLDGGEIGELQFENFNAAEAKLTIHGRNVHPGTAKNQMINSQHVAMELISMLPANERPEYTEGYEGFFHLISFTGNVEQTNLHFIIRDHDRKKFEHKKNLLQRAVQLINDKYQRQIIDMELRDQYYNMREKIEPVMHIIELAKQAMIQAEVVPIIRPVRGGTDGAMLSYMGLPTPNIFTGGHNFHGRFEFIPFQSMQKATQVVINIITLAAEGQ